MSLTLHRLSPKTNQSLESTNELVVLHKKIVSLSYIIKYIKRLLWNILAININVEISTYFTAALT